MIRTKEYGNGLRLVVKRLDGVFSVSMGVLVGVGSRFESEQTNGISHYIEHMMFKGTATRSAFDISDQIDSLGGQINAFTTKETTCYYVKSTAEHIAEAAEVVSDIFFNSVFDDGEAEREKGVIKEEINMTEDTPDELCFDLLAEAQFGKRGLGATILGPAQNVDRFTKRDIADYMLKHYMPGNVIISFAGNIEFSEAESLCDELFASRFKTQGGGDSIDQNAKYLFGDVQKRKDIEQAHLCFAFPACNYSSDENDLYMLMNAALGGGMSSVLFQKVREQLGLAYSVYSYISAYRDVGSLCVYAGVNPDKLGLATDCILTEIDAFKKRGLSEREFNRAKEQIKGAFIFNQESNASQMLLYAKYLLYTGKVFDFERKIEGINKLTLEEINKFISERVNLTDYAKALVMPR